MSLLLDAALGYAEDGWLVFPVGANKEPIEKGGHGFKDATTDPDVITRWWSNYPSAGIGAAIPSGRIVLDVDPRNGGSETFDALVAKHGSLPATWTARTGGGGMHYHFLFDGAPPATLGKGIDVKASGKGYVVLPPSPHESGAIYAWEPYCDPEEQNIAALPEAWASELVRETPTPAAAPIPEEIKQGDRNSTLASLAGSMRRRGASEEGILAALTAENKQRCKPPLDDDEVARIAASIAGYPPAPNPEADGRLIVGWDEYMAETYPPVPSLWGDALLVKTGGYLLLAGDTGVGKTILKANLILSLAEGRDEFLGFALPGRPVKCLLLEAEGSRQMFRDRLLKIAEARGIHGSLPIAFHERHTDLVIDGPNLTTMVEQSGAEYVLLDAIGRFWTGNENDATEWRAGVTTPLAKLTSAFNVAVSFNDHPSKPNENRTGHHTIKGSGAKVHDCGATLRLEIGKGGGRSRILYFDRVRDGALPFPDRDPSRLPLLIDVAAGTIAVDEAADAEGRLETAQEARHADVRKALEEINRNLGIPVQSDVASAGLRLKVQSLTGLEKSRAKGLILSARLAGAIERPRRGYYRLPGTLGGPS